jgi:hypothetical protein
MTKIKKPTTIREKKMSSKVFCHCNKCTSPAKLVGVVKKDGKLKGRDMWECPNKNTLKGGCGFTYIDGQYDGYETTTSRCNNKCHPAIKMRIQKEGPNRGRHFWSCKCCNIFEIVD